jgi:hypothetical protein
MLHVGGGLQGWTIELGGVTDDTSIRLFGGRLYTDSTLFEDVGADGSKAKQRMSHLPKSCTRRGWRWLGH